MKTTFILFAVIVMITVFNPLHSQRFLNTDSSTSIGYSAGEGQGASVIFERLSDAKNGEFGFGGLLNLRGINIDDGDQTVAILAGRLSYHPFNLIKNDRFDPYGFATLGVNFETIRNDNGYTGPREEGQFQSTIWGFGAGIKYRIFNSIGVFAEASLGTGWITTGITWRPY